MIANAVYHKKLQEQEIKEVADQLAATSIFTDQKSIV